MGITFDYFSISLLIGGFTAFLSGIVVYIHNRTKLENIAWLFSNITSAVWSFGYFATITSLTHDMAFYSDWVLHAAACLIPVCYLFSVTSITNTYKSQRVQLIIASIISGIFLVLIPTQLFVRDVIPKAHFNFVPDAGPLYIYFTAYFFLLVFYALYILFKKYKESTDEVEKARYKYMILFTLAGFGGGGSVFLLTFNISILPYPLILFSIYPAISGYAVFRYQLFDVKVITTEILVFSMWILILIRTLISTTLSDILINGGLLLFMIMAGVLLVRSVIKEVRLREQLDISNTKLKESNAGQANLIHFMNHQVKGRFGNAKNIFAELLTNDYGEMPEFAKPLLQKGLEETTMGVDYVQSILKGASAENGTLPYDMRKIDFKTVVRDVSAKQKEYADKKGLVYSFAVRTGEYSIIGDETQLGEAVKNLIDNSITYTEHGSVSVSLSSLEHMVQLKVEDTGVGIKESDKPKLFKSGGRGADSLKININSTGYGLAFVKGVVEAHKGKVWVESEQGKGSTFYIELPKA